MRLLVVHTSDLRGTGRSGRHAMPSGSTTTLELVANLTETLLPVLELAARLPARHHDSGGQMSHPHSRVGRVDALASWPVAAKRLEHAVAGKLLERLCRHVAIFPLADRRIAHVVAPISKSAGRETSPPPRHTTPSYTTHDWPGATACTRSENATRAPCSPTGSTTASLNGPV